jgi:phosphatidate phosphatase APP1
MRPSVCLLLALLSSSCATFPQITTCPEKPDVPSTRNIVISDIDDTIKDTHVRLAGTHAYNPLLVLDPVRPWRAVPGMARYYEDKKWADHKRTTVIYVSAGQCTPSRKARIEQFICAKNFPEGPIVLRKGGTPIPPHDYKAKAISPIICRGDGHHFTLVGDSGEFDPESYGELARQFPKRVDAIYIRIATRETDDRFKWAFRGINNKKLHFIPMVLPAGIPSL